VAWPEARAAQQYKERKKWRKEGGINKQTKKVTKKEGINEGRKEGRKEGGRKEGRRCPYLVPCCLHLTESTKNSSCGEFSNRASRTYEVADVFESTVYSTPFVPRLYGVNRLTSTARLDDIGSATTAETAAGNPSRASGFLRPWKTWTSHGVLKWSFPGLEKSWKKLKSQKFWKSHENVLSHDHLSRVLNN